MLCWAEDFEASKVLLIPGLFAAVFIPVLNCSANYLISKLPAHKGTLIDKHKSTRDTKTKNVVNKRMDKILKFDYDKRVIEMLMMMKLIHCLFDTDGSLLLLWSQKFYFWINYELMVEQRWSGLEKNSWFYNGKSKCVVVTRVGLW